jgi:HPr kinase/phosphorylase
VSEAGLTQKTISVQELMDARADVLELEVLNPDIGLASFTDDPDVTSPGLALAGHTSRVPSGRMWVFGETEMTYLSAIGESEGRIRLAALFAFGVPAAFVTKRQQVPGFFLAVAAEHGVPVLRSSHTTKEFYRRLKPYLEVALAPSTAVHGSLADVYGVGVLFTGKSGVGKSECVLDLVERGHRLVADDLVLVTRQGYDVLIGRGHELQRHHMEIRGVGIIDIEGLFGVRAIRQQKRIEVIISLELWEQQREYTRTGLERDHEEILGVRIPKVTVPLNPGKNITVISEVVAMSQLLRFTGEEPAEAFDRRLRQYLEQDYE